MTTKREKQEQDEQENGLGDLPALPGEESTADEEEKPGTLEFLTEGEGADMGVASMFKEFLSDKNIDMKTDIPVEDIPALVELTALGVKYHSKEIPVRLKTYYRLRLSGGRESRRELGRMFQAMREEQSLREARDLP